MDENRPPRLVTTTPASAADLDSAAARRTEELSPETSRETPSASRHVDLEGYARLLERKVEKRTLELQEKCQLLEAKNQEILHTRQQLITQEKMASLGTLIAGVVHEIQNPLNFVRNFVKLSMGLMKDLDEELPAEGKPFAGEALEEVSDIVAQLRQNIDKIGKHGERIDVVVRGMLNLSRGAATSPVPTDLNQLVSESVNLAYHGMRGSSDRSLGTAELRIDLDESIGQVDVMPHDFGRVLLNLTGNGLYATLEKSRSLKGHQPELVVTTADRGDTVEIRVRDNGTGIPEDLLDEVFNPFFTTKPTGKGTGLGLSICRQIVAEQHHGTITVDTELGEYTEFTVRLPKKAGRAT